jgi:hypothetical protein
MDRTHSTGTIDKPSKSQRHKSNRRGKLTSSGYRGVLGWRPKPGNWSERRNLVASTQSHTFCRPSPAEMFTWRASPRRCLPVSYAAECRMAMTDSRLGLRVQKLCSRHDGWLCILGISERRAESQR